MNNVQNTAVSVKSSSVVRDILHDVRSLPRETVESAAQTEGTSRPVVLAVLAALADHASWTYGDCYPAQWSLVQSHGWSDRTIRRAIRTLEKLEIIETKRHEQAFAVYGNVYGTKVRNLNRVAYYFRAWATRHKLTPRPELSPEVRAQYDDRKVLRKKRYEARQAAFECRKTNRLTINPKRHVDPSTRPAQKSAQTPTSLGAVLSSASPRTSSERVRLYADSQTEKTSANAENIKQMRARAEAFEKGRIAFARYRSLKKGVCGGDPPQVPPTKPLKP